MSDLRISPPGPLMEIHFLDSMSAAHWTPPSEGETLLKQLACVVVGYLVKEDSDGILLAQGLSGVDDHLSPMAIPRSAITHVIHHAAAEGCGPDELATPG